MGAYMGIQICMFIKCIYAWHICGYLYVSPLLVSQTHPRCGDCPCLTTSGELSHALRPPSSSPQV